MGKAFSLEIKTPEKLLFSGEIESLIVPHKEGLEGYLANHTRVLRELVPGTLEYRPIGSSQETTKMEIPGGFISFAHNRAVVFIRS